MAPTIDAYSNPIATYTLGLSIDLNVPSLLGGPAVSYQLEPELPNGLVFNTSTGVISGSPTEIRSMTIYNATVYNTGGSNSYLIAIGVDDGMLTFISLPYHVYNCFYSPHH